MNNMDKYVYLIPGGGLNDILCTIQSTIHYCIRHNRILLIDTIHSPYKINFSDYFDIEYTGIDIIYDLNKIKSKCRNRNYSIWPRCLNINIHNVLNGKIMKLLKYRKGCYHSYKNVVLILPKKTVKEDIILYIKCGGGNGFVLFKKILLKPTIKDYCKKKYLSLNNKYLCLQIRNTDIKSDYEQLYENNKDIIHSYPTIYIATDYKPCIDFFKSKELPIFNFNTFPKNVTRNLHFANMDPDTKIKCVLCDIYIITMSDKLLSNSKGGFYRLIKQCHNNKTLIKDKFE